MHRILRFALLLAPLPLFIDLETLSFWVNIPPIGDYDALAMRGPGIPLPLATAPASMLVGFALLGVILKSNIKVFSESNLVFGGLFALLFGAISYLMGVKLTTIVQMALPLLFLSAIPRITVGRKLDSYILSYGIGILIWISSHTFSIFTHHDYEFFEIDRNWNYSTFFGVQIYQALVSYSATMSIFSIFGIFLIHCNFVIYGFTIVLVSSFLGLASNTRLFVLDLAVIFGINLLFLCLNLKSRVVGLRQVLILGFFFVLVCIGQYFFFQRVFQLGASDRFELIRNGLLEIASKEDLVFFGAGNKHSEAHNFFIDFILNYGLVMGFLYFMVLFYCGLVIIRKLSTKETANPILLMLFGVLFTNSFFNSAITQPLFYFNWFIALVLIMSKWSSPHFDRT